MKESRHQFRTSLIVCCVLTALAIPSAAADWGSYKLRIKADGHWYEFSHEDLLDLSTRERTSTKGARTRPIIPLTVLLGKGVGAPLDRLERLVFVSNKKSLLLEGSHLEHLDNLSLKLGNIRPSILPEDDETWRALQPEFGKPRFKDVEIIYVWVTPKKGQGQGDGKGKGQAAQMEDG